MSVWYRDQNEVYSNFEPLFHWIGCLIGEFRWWILIGQVAICGLFIGRNCIQLLSFSILSKPEGRERSWTVNSWIEFPLDLSPRAFTFGILKSFMVFIICIYQTDFEFKFRILVFEHFLNVHECISCTGILLNTGPFRNENASSLETREFRRKSSIFGTISGKKSVKTFVIFHGENFWWFNHNSRKGYSCLFEIKKFNNPS